MPGKSIAVGNAKADPKVPTIPQALPRTWFELSVTLLGFRQNVRIVQTVNPDHASAISIAGRFRFGVTVESVSKFCSAERLRLARYSKHQHSSDEAEH